LPQRRVGLVASVFQFLLGLAAVFAEEVGEFGKAMPNGNYWQNTYKCAV
tara:strand:+ start:94 stop:240 length:147 start_codon:yes stop_codon:yes gene_type:complete